MDDSIFDIFREEARDHLVGLEKGFLDLESAGSSDSRKALIDTLFRHAHSLKGDAKALGLLPIKQSAQALEDHLDILRENPDSVDTARINVGLSKFDVVRSAIEAWQREFSRESRESGSRTHPGDAVESPTTLASVAEEPEPATPVVDATTGLMPAAARLGPSEFVERRTSAGPETFAVRVPAERLDRMLNLAGEVRIAMRAAGLWHARLAELEEQIAWLLQDLPQLSEREQRQTLESSLDQIQRLQRGWHNQIVRQGRLMEGLESDVRQARLLPMVMLAQSMRRTVRDLSQSLGKEIDYEVDVGQILLDKAVIEGLREPLLHLIRNAADHGIESPAERLAKGKPVRGHIRVSAAQRGQFVQLSISDDGGGLNFDRIRQRVRRLGVLSDEEIDSLTNADLVPYLFRPGFTTALVGDISGRGVGLDVVSSAIRALQGTTQLATTSSSGTTFEMTVPVSISTIRVLTISSGGQFLGIPASTVIRTGQAKRSDLGELEGNPVLRLDRELIQWVALPDLLGTASNPSPDRAKAVPYLLVRVREKVVAIAVDDLEDEGEVLLKPLGFPLDGVPGFVGGTIRPDGSVQLVLELESLLRDGMGPAATPIQEPALARRILLVDDSPTTRAILRNLFTASGYSVTVATDGLDALDKLRGARVDLVVSDVDMPRLNGFDLTRQIKSRYGIPVVLVTGREREEHRREGLEAGADAYVVKSTFEGQGLMEIVEQFI